MKIRNGFVSNSSSSSFCIYGADDINPEILLKNFKKLVTEGKVQVSPWILELLNEEEEGDLDELCEILYNYKDIQAFNMWDELYVNVSYTRMKGDETRNEFEARVREMLLKLDPMITGFSVQQEAWRDG